MVACCVDFISFMHEAFERVDVIYIDFTREFDSIVHGTLTYGSTLLDQLDINDPLQSWLSSYLLGRRQRVSL